MTEHDKELENKRERLRTPDAKEAENRGHAAASVAKMPSPTNVTPAAQPVAPRTLPGSEEAAASAIPANTPSSPPRPDASAADDSGDRSTTGAWVLLPPDVDVEGPGRDEWFPAEPVVGAKQVIRVMVPSFPAGMPPEPHDLIYTYTPDGHWAAEDPERVAELIGVSPWYVPADPWANDSLDLRADQIWPIRFDPAFAARTYIESGHACVLMHGLSDDAVTCTCGLAERCKRSGGHPLVVRGQVPVLTEAALRSPVLRQSPPPNLAIATGAESGIVALRISPKAAQSGSLERLRPMLPETSFRWWADRGYRYIALRSPEGRRIGSGLLPSFPDVMVFGERDRVLVPPSRSRWEGTHMWPPFRWVQPLDAMAFAGDELTELLSRVPLRETGGGAW